MGENDGVKHPHVHVRMVGEDGNAFSVIGRCISAMRRAGCTTEEIDAFKSEAMSGDYNHLLATVMKHFSVDDDDEVEEDLDELLDELDEMDEDELDDDGDYGLTDEDFEDEEEEELVDEAV